MEKKNLNGQNSVATSAKDFDNFFENLAKQAGVKRYSPEYNRFLWVNLLGVSPEVYDATENRK